MKRDGFADGIDLGILIDMLFAGGTPPAVYPSCPAYPYGNSDLNCDGFPDVLDMGWLIDYIYAGGPVPCDPCACTPYSQGCPQ